MIWLYTGTPGSGKSLDTARDIMFKLRRGQRVIANFPVNMKIVQKGQLRKIPDDNFINLENTELSVKYLVKFARKNHKRGKEGQTLVVIDECSVMFNSRDWNRPDRKAWIKFLQHHRKYGYNVILISQSPKPIDKQILAFVEYEVKHRKANNYGTIGMLFTLFHIPLFCAIEYWYGVSEKCNVRFFIYSKKHEKLYDSYKVFDFELEDELLEDPAAPAKKTSKGTTGAPARTVPFVVLSPVVIPAPEVGSVYDSAIV